MRRSRQRPPLTYNRSASPAASDALCTYDCAVARCSARHRGPAAAPSPRSSSAAQRASDRRRHLPRGGQLRRGRRHRHRRHRRDLVTDLTQNDFEVLEDGRPQTVSAFSLVNIPIERAERPLFAAAPIEADVQTNEHVEGRIYLIVLDDTAHRRHTRAAREEAPRAASSSRASAPTTSRPSSSRAAAAATRRTSPTARGCCSPPSTSSPAASCARRRSSALEQSPASGTAGSPPATTRATWSAPIARARRCPRIRKLADFMAGVRGRRKATAAHRRRRGLQHLTTSWAGRHHGVGGARGHAGGDRGGDPRQRQHLCHRPARPGHRSRPT